MSKYIKFDMIGDTGKTEIWNVLSKTSSGVLGQIKWYGPWRQYCFFSEPNCIFNTKCLDDIKKMINKLMAVRRYR